MEREALIILAEMLDKARIQANAIDLLVIQSQRGVYGQIVLALHDVLEQIVGDTEDPSLDADKVYVSIFADGNTVRQALTWWEGLK